MTLAEPMERTHERSLKDRPGYNSHHLYGLGSSNPDVNNIEAHLLKARSHLERLHLDLYKHFILGNLSQIDSLEKKIEKDLKKILEPLYPLPDITQFQVWFNQERKRVMDVIVSAKAKECMQNRHDKKIELLSDAMICQEKFIARTNDKYESLQPYIAEAIEIAKRNRKQFYITTYVVPVVTLILGYLFGKFL